MSLEVAIEKQVRDFRLAVEFTAEGAPLGLLGSSGSGKTMTLRAIAGLDTPDRGRIILERTPETRHDLAWRSAAEADLLNSGERAGSDPDHGAVEAMDDQARRLRSVQDIDRPCRD